MSFARVRLRPLWPAVLLVLPLLAGCITDAEAPADDVAAATADPAGAGDDQWAHRVDWKGHLVAGPLDRFAHTQPTESAVAPFARMGFLADIPEGTTRMRMLMEWPQGVAMHLMAHGPHEADMPTYMTGWPTNGEACFEVPPDQILPGTWRVMAHARDDAIDLAFTVRLETDGVDEPRILEDPHGHRIEQDGGATMREPLPCEPAQE